MSIEPVPPLEIEVDEQTTLRRISDVPPSEMFKLVRCNLNHLGTFLAWAKSTYSETDAKNNSLLARGDGGSQESTGTASSWTINSPAP